MKKGVVIGIDPDVDKNGIAIYQRESKTLELYALSFFQLFDLLVSKKELIKEVIVEASWLIKKANFHNESKGVRVSSNIGSRTGANHEVGRKIIEMCEYLKIPCQGIRPLKKRWKGREGKITHEEFFKLTGYSFSTNQEKRDAGLLVWGY
ncbi:hypothetical protein SMI01S_11830 [Sphingobacterium mizutaii NBRC 14946 = DSM 11724]|uniref:Uncharacterized protein n=3 Tax=Sphingobacterium mizutaii TaxID=1010 RepID=A0AAJ5C121_9SPHI|nr:hypothetical protein [Sphingobacterium mizutaii]GEM67577.1 hypothetical protein SMI01S_11830 [Sphingobacterium mizutaii NBRC 14946 = DSM 11724]SDL14573.1 hypothetical protein SAMN05192578_1011517 [Sphingobacterium mizutaii]SNV52171.1 Uncharacterised protein [Sphingobacterium mizutaii]